MTTQWSYFVLLVQRKLALDLACRCVEEAYQAREGPALQHAAHFRAFGWVPSTQSSHKLQRVADAFKIPLIVTLLIGNLHVQIQGFEEDSLPERWAPLFFDSTCANFMRMPTLLSGADSELQRMPSQCRPCCFIL